MINTDHWFSYLLWLTSEQNTQTKAKPSSTSRRTHSPVRKIDLIFLCSPYVNPTKFLAIAVRRKVLPDTQRNHKTDHAHDLGKPEGAANTPKTLDSW